MRKEKGGKIMGKNTDFIKEKCYISSILFKKLKEFGAVLALPCCPWVVFISCSKWGPLFIVVCRLLIAVVSLVEERRF